MARREICTPMLIAALFTVAKTWKQPKCLPTEGWTEAILRIYGEGNGNPLQCSCLGNSIYRGAWQATAHGVTKGQTQLSD